MRQQMLIAIFQRLSPRLIIYAILPYHLLHRIFQIPIQLLHMEIILILSCSLGRYPRPCPELNFQVISIAAHAILHNLSFILNRRIIWAYWHRYNLFFIIFKSKPSHNLLLKIQHIIKQVFKSLLPQRFVLFLKLFPLVLQLLSCLFQFISLKAQLSSLQY